MGPLHAAKDHRQVAAIRTDIDILHNTQDIECKYSFWECKYTAILHSSTPDCTAVVRLNGGKLILSLIHLCNCRIINN